MKRFVDASLVIDVMGGTERGERFTKVFAEIEGTWCASPLVRLECRVRALSRRDERRLREIDALLGTTTSLPLTDAVYDLAAEIRAATGLKTPDALHLATALTHGCAEFWTADARLSRVVVESLVIQLLA